VLRDAWIQTAASAAVVGAVFGVVFFSLLVWNYCRYIHTLQKEEQRDQLKIQVHTAADSNAAVSRIRALDLDIRQNRVQYLAFTHRCSVLLVVSVAVFLLGLKGAGFLKGPQPHPDKVTDQGQIQLSLARYARYAVCGALLVLGGMGLFLLMKTPVSHETAEQGPNYASWEELGQQWHRFRGRAGAGICPFTRIPAAWNGKTGQGILWKAEIPLPGHNSPVVWQDRVFLSGADENRRQVYCLDTASGQRLWTGDVPTVPSEGEDLGETGLAAGTMATDGKRVYVIFATGDLAAFDFHGRRRWHQNLGWPDSTYGYASSLEVFQDRVLVQYDQGSADDGKSRLFAFDGPTGKKVWETPRPVGGSWTSPVVVRINDAFQLFTVGSPWVIAYDPNNGSELWRAEAVGGDVAASPIVAQDYVIAVEPYSQTVAVRWDGRGDVTQTHIAWRNNDAAPDIASPVSDGEFIYLLDTQGLLACLQTSDGKQVYEYDLKAMCQASPSLVGDKLYVLDEKGTMHIGSAGATFEPLAVCELGERCTASPAFAQGRIYIRGEKHLYCIGE
jgi:outer membrane protein assembly factor BamB